MFPGGPHPRQRREDRAHQHNHDRRRHRRPPGSRGESTSAVRWFRQAVYRLAAAIRGWCQWQERPAGEATPWEQWLETDVPTGWLLLATILCSLAQATVHELTRGGWPVVQADTGLLGWPSTAAHTLWSAAAAAAQLMVQQATASASDAWLMLLAFTIKYTALALTYDWVCRTTLASCRAVRRYSVQAGRWVGRRAGSLWRQVREPRRHRSQPLPHRPRRQSSWGQRLKRRASARATRLRAAVQAAFAAAVARMRRLMGVAARAAAGGRRAAHASAAHLTQLLRKQQPSSAALQQLAPAEEQLPLEAASGSGEASAAAAGPQAATGTAAAVAPEPAAAAHAAAADAGSSAPECCVCLEAPATTALVPCGHVALCEGCARAVMRQRQPHCPVCRCAAKSRLRVFF